MLTSLFGATAQNHSQLADEQLARFMNDVQLDEEPQPFFFDKEFKYFYNKTPLFDNGHKMAIYDFQVAGQHRDYFLVTINSDMRSFTMKTRVSPVFLNIMMQASGELDHAHPDTNAILAGMRETTDILVSEVGNDFELVWSEGIVYTLPFECFPNAHRQLLWHQGCNKLHVKRRSSFNIDPNTAHQQTAILRVTFVGVAKQQMGSLRADDLIIQTPPRNNFLNTGFAPPQPSAFSGGGVGGSGGGFGGSSGNSGHHGRSGLGRHNGAPASLGTFPTSRASKTNAVVQPTVNHTELERRRQQINSRSQWEVKMDVDAAARKTANPGATNVVEEVYSDYMNEHAEADVDLLFGDL